MGAIVAVEEEIMKCPLVNVYEDGLRRYRYVKLIAESDFFWIIEIPGQRPDLSVRKAIIIIKEKGWTIGPPK